MSAEDDGWKFIDLGTVTERMSAQGAEPDEKDDAMFSLFICGVPDTRLVCKTPGCGKKTSFTCTMPLAGKAAGKLCGRPVCSDCLRGTAACPPHQAKERTPRV